MVSGHRLTFNSPNMLQCTSKTVQIFLKCGQIRIMLLMNEFEFGPYLVHLWSVLGERDLYNKRYSFEQNHKMLNPNHLRNVQPHLFVEKKIQNSQFQLEQFKISLKRAFTDNFRKIDIFFIKISYKYRRI